jgi:hypothetical protein
MQQKRKDVNRMQAAQTPPGESILDEVRSVVSRNGSRYVNIPAAAERIISFGDGRAEVRVYHDHIRVYPRQERQEGQDGE